MSKTVPLFLVFIVLVISFGVLLWSNPQWFNTHQSPCCVDEQATIYQIVQWTQCGRFSCWSAWDLYYRVYSVIPSTLRPDLIGTTGIYTVRCNYFQVGMNFTLNRNIQPPSVINWMGTVANGTDFTTIVNPVIHGC